MALKGNCWGEGTVGAPTEVPGTGGTSGGVNSFAVMNQDYSHLYTDIVRTSNNSTKEKVNNCPIFIIAMLIYEGTWNSQEERRCHDRRAFTDRRKAKGKAHSIRQSREQKIKEIKKHQMQY